MRVATVAVTGQVVSGYSRCWGYLVGTDDTNDVTVAIESGVAATKTAITPTDTVDASALGSNGVMFNKPIPCENGIYATITCAGTAEVYVYYDTEKSFGD